MTFMQFMKKQRKEDTPAGDLARDIIRDNNQLFRASLSDISNLHSLIRNYLERKHACRECIRTFEQCWREYAAQETGVSAE